MSKGKGGMNSMMDPTLIPVYIINTTPVNYTPDRATRIYVLDLTWGGDTLDAGVAGRIFARFDLGSADSHLRVVQ